MIPTLGDKLAFPVASMALKEPDGLLACGGDLSVARLLLAYASGIFPWYSAKDPILWWSPSARMVLFPDRLRVSRSLAKALRNRRYEIRVDTAFREVIEACAQSRERALGTWIVADMVEAYCHLFAAGFAHSFETWVDEKLVGGIYGVSIGRMFYGESMFSSQRDASKLALVHLVRRLSCHDVTMIDCQMYTSHLASLGACLVPRECFLSRLTEQICKPAMGQIWAYQYINDGS